MAGTQDWRDLFCGRTRELHSLMTIHGQVAAGDGPRFAVVLGDRGMGKTRLVQEFYRSLAAAHDPQRYWPDAAIFMGDNLNVAPSLADPLVRAHYQGFMLEQRLMPYLWWGFRLSDPAVRNAARNDMAAHRATLDLHLGPIQFARRIAAKREQIRAAGIDSATELGQSILKEAIKAIPGIGIAASIAEIAIDYADKAKAAAEALREEQRLKARWSETTLLQTESERVSDIHERTLADLEAVMAPAEGMGSVPCVVFCDDAQFARQGGDEGAAYFLEKLWARATAGSWPLLLILTHWSLDWHRYGEGAEEAGVVGALKAAAPQRGLVLELSKEPELAGVVEAGLPALPREDLALLVDKADGNPQVLIELIELVRRSPAWRRRADGALTPHARREIEQSTTGLAALILDRLKSDSTPEAVRQAAALASVQGMEFLRVLTEQVAGMLQLPETPAGLRDAEHPHRLIVGLDEGVSGFVQRAYFEAAASLLSGHVGDPEEVRQALLDAAVGMVDDAALWEGLARQGQVATLGVLVELAEAHEDPATRRRAGRALLAMVATAMQGEGGADFARAAALAQRFERGLGQRWSIGDYPLAEVDAARQAIALWFGVGQTRGLAGQMLDRARTLSNGSDAAEPVSELMVALDRVAAVADADGNWEEVARIREESLALARDQAARSDSLHARHLLSIALERSASHAHSRGSLHAARGHYEEALALRRGLAGIPDMPDGKRDLGIVLHRLGDLAGAAGDDASAIRLYQESVALHRELLARHDTYRARLDLGHVLGRLGAAVQDNGDLETAWGHCRESLDIFRGIVSGSGTPEARRGLSIALERVGSIAEARSDWAAAGSAYQESLALRRALASGEDSIDARRDLSVALDRMGGVARTGRDWEAADRIYRECVEIDRDIASRLASPEAQRDLSVSLGRLGMVAEARGDPELAGQCYAESLAIDRGLVARLGSHEVKRDLSASLHRVAALCANDGDPAGAQRHYQESLQLCRELVAQMPTPATMRDLSITLERIGGLAQAGGDLPRARSLLDESISLHRTLVDRLGTPDARRELGLVLGRAGLAAEAAGDDEAAWRHYSESVGIGRELVQALDSVQERQALSVSLERAGMFARSRNDWETARSCFEECLAICRWLVASSGSDDARRSLSVALERLGSVAEAIKDWATVVRCFEESVQIRRDLAAALGTPRAWRELGIGLRRVGGIARNNGDIDAAGRCHEESLQIFHALTENGGSAELWADLAVSLDLYGEVAGLQGQLDVAWGCCERSVRIRREILARSPGPEAKRGLFTSLFRAAKAAEARGDGAYAAQALQECLSLRSELEAVARPSCG